MDASKSGTQQTAGNTIPVIAVIGAGPKAAALATKAQVLKELGLGEVNVIVIERDSIAANWSGRAGFTDGQGELGTPPEKDVGFPYHSIFGSKVDMAMLRYSWQASLISLTAYSDWVDRGRENPRHEKWAAYLKWAMELTLPEEVMIGTVERVVPSNGRLRIDVRHEGQTNSIEADGLVITGPGKPLQVDNMPSAPSELILDGKNYWNRISVFKEMPSGKVALIGGGETAASIALSLLKMAPRLEIEIINRHGTIFTRGESYGENKLFSNPDEWTKLDEPKRDEFIRRTDRGVFSVNAQIILGKADNITYLSGKVSKLEEEGNKIIAYLEHGKNRATTTEKYDRVIVALGFDPWSTLELFPQGTCPVTGHAELRKQVDYYLRVPFDSAPGLGGSRINVHMPMVSGLSQGPGFPNLSCLGHLSDRILALYVTMLQIEQAKDKTWLWKKVTQKGKIIRTAGGFQSREECEADARRNEWQQSLTAEG